MTSPPTRSPFWPSLGLILLFAVIGPAVGGAVFIPLTFLLEAPVEAEATMHLTWIATLIGHALALIPAYLLGFGPALATGALFAAYDHFAPPRAPRALAAAVIGALLAQAMFARLAALGLWIDAAVRGEIGGAGGDWFYGIVGENFDLALRHAFVASGALAAFICALTANLVGFTRPNETANGANLP